ncbi:MAG TPA: tellurite resistance TerB C-terminal domain-containing protein, partial [Coleofasciculaceae cyanobacterium]
TAALKKIADKKATMPEVLIESINEKAIHSFGDTLFMSGSASVIPEVYEEYIPIFVKPITIYFKDLLDFQEEQANEITPVIEELQFIPPKVEVIVSALPKTWRCIHTLKHSANSLTISSDGKTLITGGKDGEIKLWNLATGELLNTLSGHSSSVESVAIASTSQIFVSGSGDSTIKLWNLKTGELLYTFSGHTSSVSSVAISPDGKILASGSYDKSIKLWDITKKKSLRTLQGVSSLVSSITFSPKINQKLLTAGIQNGQILQWNLKADSSPTTLVWNPKKVEAITMSPDGNTLIMGDAEGTIKTFNLSIGIDSSSFPSNQGSVLSIAVSPDGRTLLSAGNDIRLWNLDSRELLEGFSEHSSKVCAVAFSSSGENFISSSQDETVKIWQYD